MKSMARGLIRPQEGAPALHASTRQWPCSRGKASAIWLRLRFSTHKEDTLRGCWIAHGALSEAEQLGVAPAVGPRLRLARLDSVDLDARGVLVDVVHAEQCGQPLNPGRGRGDTAI